MQHNCYKTILIKVLQISKLCVSLHHATRSCILKIKNISIMVDLTKYESKAVLQLLKSSNSFNAILPTYSNKMINDWLISRYNLTSKQLTYILNNI